MLDMEKISEVLKGTKVLIVDDDEHLPQRLVNEFKRYGSESNVKHTVEEGLAELNDNGSEYDLIVIDVMLPKNEEDYKKIESYREELEECFRIIKDEDSADPDDEEFKRKWERARGLRPHLHKRITSLIRKKGGIEIIKEWLEQLKSEKAPPILYLTAIGDEAIMAEGIEATGAVNSIWLVKPVTVEKLLNTSAKLILAGKEKGE